MVRIHFDPRPPRQPNDNAAHSRRHRHWPEDTAIFRMSVVIFRTGGAIFRTSIAISPTGIAILRTGVTLIRAGKPA